MPDLWKTGGFEFSLLAVKATELPYQIQLRFFFLVVHTDNVSIQFSFHLHQKSPNQGVRHQMSSPTDYGLTINNVLTVQEAPDIKQARQS